MSGFDKAVDALALLQAVSNKDNIAGIQNIGKNLENQIKNFNVGSEVDKAMSKLQGKAFQTSKAYLQSINIGINSAVEGFNDLASNIGAIFHKKKKKQKSEEVKEPPPRFENPNPYIYGGYSLNINGRDLGVDRLAYVTDLTIEQNVGASDTCSFTVKDPNMYFIEDDIYMRNTPIKASISLLNDGKNSQEDMLNRIYFDGYISAIDIDFPDDGAPVLTVNCVDKPTHEMNQKKWRRSWENVNSAQVVQIIAQEMGYQCYVEEDYTFPIQSTIIQDNKTNIEFLEELASKELELFVCHTVVNMEGAPIIYYVIRGKIDEEMYVSLAYKQSNMKQEKDTSKQVMYDVVSFRPQINIETRDEEVESKGIDHDTKEIVSYTAPVGEAVDENATHQSSDNEGAGGDSSSGGGRTSARI